MTAAGQTLAFSLSAATLIWPVRSNSLVEADLNKQLIDAGAKLVRSLDKKGLSPDAAFWLYSSDNKAWRLFLVEAKLGEVGPKGVYRQKVIKELPEESQVLSLSDIGLLRSDAPFVQRLRTAFRKGRNVSGTRLMNNVVNGKLIEDAYIYRIA
ncbi:MAG: hypothetical protein WD795_15725 [Woeseia sp.]